MSQDKIDPFDILAAGGALKRDVDASAAIAAKEASESAAGVATAAKVAAQNAAVAVVTDFVATDYVGGLVESDGRILIGVKSTGQLDFRTTPETQTNILSPIQASYNTSADNGYAGGLLAEGGQVLLGFDSVGRTDLVPTPALLARISAGIVTTIAAAAAEIAVEDVLLPDTYTAGQYVGGMTDSEGRVILGVMMDGKLDFTPSDELVEFIVGQVVIPPSSAALIYRQGLNGPGNCFGAEQVAPTLIRFHADGLAKTATFIQRTDIESPTAMLETAGPMEWLSATGQSLSTGGGATEDADIYSPTPRVPYAGLMFNTGTRGGANAVFNPALTTDFVDAYEVYNGHGLGDTQGSGMMAALWAREHAPGAKRSVYAYRSHGRGGSSIVGISKGTNAYANGLAEFARAKEIAALYGRQIRCRSITFSHGETDRLMPYAEYYGHLDTLVTDYFADMTPLNTNGEQPLFIIDQLCADRDGAASDVGLAQLEIARTRAGVYMSTPKYMLEMTDDVHLTGKAYSILGEYQAQTRHAVLVDEEDWAPLWPTAVERVGTQVDITFHVPRGNLEWDTVTLPPRTNFGFEYSTATIMSATIIGADKVRLILNAAVAGDVSYAYGPGPGSTTRAGAWGNLRDSGAEPTVTDPTIKLHNWCVIFKESVA